MKLAACPVCGSEPVRHLTDWLRSCSGCGLRLARLEEAGPAVATLTGWDDHAESAMAPIRRAAAARLLDVLAELTVLQGKRLLEVGCGPGWFLRAAADAGMMVAGIEPDPRLAERAREAGLDVATGYFPGSSAGATYDVLAFNDVFEHLPAPLEALAAIRERLEPGGLLLLNLPSRHGAIYRASEALAHLGVTGPLERMWQKGFESPHLFYYGPMELGSMVEAQGFECVRGFALPSIAVEGLWRRIRAGSRRKLLFDLLIYLAALAAVPLLRVLPPDGMVRVYRRP